MKKFDCFALLSEGIVAREQIHEQDSSEVHCGLGANLAAAEAERNGRREEKKVQSIFPSIPVAQKESEHLCLLTAVQKLAGT